MSNPIRLLWPVSAIKVIITCDFACHKARPGYKGSLANDLASLGGVKIPLYASQNNGKVTESHFDSTGYGNEVIVEYPDVGIKMQLGHMDSRAHTANFQVNAGELLGVMGTTGNSTGIHTHWAVWKKINGAWVNIDPLDPANGIVMVNTVEELGEIVPPPPPPPTGDLVRVCFGMHPRLRSQPAVLPQNIIVEALHPEEIFEFLEEVEADGRLWTVVKCYIAAEFTEAV
jgi:hypothetical protein